MERMIAWMLWVAAVALAGAGTIRCPRRAARLAPVLVRARRGR
jgi:hypothetical protein